MEIVIKAVDGVLEFDAIQVITESEFAKINADVNQQRIVAWCTDNGSVVVSAERGVQQPVCIMRQIENEVGTSLISETERKMHRFLEFVDTLPEVDLEDEKGGRPVDENEVAKFLEKAKKIVKGIDEKELHGTVVVTEIGAIGFPRCYIDDSMLRELLISYIEKYGQN